MSANGTKSLAGEFGRINGLFHDGLEHIGCPLSPEIIEQLTLYVVELQKWNRRINLIARKTGVVDIVERHFLDSLTLLPFLTTTGEKDKILLDVGTGAGFPGLVLAVARPDLQIILVEPRAKRVSFLRHIVRSLQLDNVEIMHARLDETGMLVDQTVEWVTCRALVEANIFLAMVEPLMDRGAGALLMLGPGQERRLLLELPEYCCVETGSKINLPWSGAKRFISVVKAKKNTGKMIHGQS